MSITRRIFLRNTAAVGAAGVICEAFADDGSDLSHPGVDPYAKIDRLAGELAKAMQAVHPDINFYTVDHDLGVVMCASGMKRGTRVEVATA